MARLFGLIVTGAFLALFAVGVFAQDFPGDTGVVGAPTDQPTYSRGPWGPGPASDVCSAIAASRTPPNTGTVDPFTGAPQSVYCNETGSDGGGQGGEYLYLVSDTPSCTITHSVLDTTDNMCHCTSPYIVSPGACINKPCGALGTPATGVEDGSSYPGTEACVSGCQIHSTSTITVTTATGGSQVVGVGPFVNTGGSCTTGSTPLPTQQTDCYKQGMDAGTVNGVVVCTPASGPITKSTTTTSTTTTTGGSGSTGGTSVGTSTGGTSSGDGTTTTTVTDNGNGSRTTVISTTHPDGSVTSTTSTGPAADPAPDFCAEHPNLAVCIISKFSANCSGEVTSCTGDAIQCAVAREQAVRNCQFFQPDTVLGSPLHDDAQRFGDARNDGDVPSWSPAASANQGGATLDFSSGIDTSSTFGQSCIQDQSIAVGGGLQAVVIPWSQFCNPLQIAGMALFAVTFVACAFIVFGK